MKNKIIRASYSFLSAWSQGRHEEALSSYFHMDRITPERYVDGDRLDREATEYIEKHAKLPEIWGGDTLDEYHTQYKTKVPYNALCELVIVMDVYENRGIITELKSGKSSSSDYARTKQVPLYLYVCNKLGLKATMAQIIRYNQHTGERDRSYLYPSEKMFLDVENWIDSIVPEIHDYFTENDLWHDEETIKKRLTKQHIV